MNTRDELGPREESKARTHAIESLVRMSGHAKKPLRTALREIHAAETDSVEALTDAKRLALSVMRHRNTLDFLLRQEIPPENLRRLSSATINALRMAVYEGLWNNSPLENILELYSEPLDPFRKSLRAILNMSIQKLTKKMPKVNRLSLTLSQPTFLVRTLLENMPHSDAIELLKSLNEPRSYYLRPNRLHDDADLHIRSLEDLGVVFNPDNEVPQILEIKEGIQHVVQSPSFAEGSILIQDKASVIAVNALNPMPDQKIWDACAAPGMKTQLIAERVGVNGRVVASDVYRSRVLLGKQRTRYLKAKNIEWIHSDATKPAVTEIDKILIDAPCTSTGVFQTFPSFKWSLNKKTLFALMTIQNKILDGILHEFSGCPGTEIVFATCSLLPHEGESQIDSALGRHRIELLPLPDVGSPGYPGFGCSSSVRRLFPHKHRCNGFFIARLRIRP